MRPEPAWRTRLRDPQPSRIRCHRRKGIGRPGRRFVRPGPARTGSRLVRPAREYEPGRGQGHAPVPAVHKPCPRAPLGWWSERRGRRPAAAPGLRSGMFLPAEVTRGAVITGEFRARRRDRRPAAHGRLRRGGRAGRRHGAGVLVTAMPRFRCGRRYHRGDAAEPGGNPSSTGHVWITIWRRSGCDRFRIFSPAKFIDASCAQPPTLVISPGLA